MDLEEEGGYVSIPSYGNSWYSNSSSSSGSRSTTGSSSRPSYPSYRQETTAPSTTNEKVVVKKKKNDALKEAIAKKTKVTEDNEIPLVDIATGEIVGHITIPKSYKDIPSQNMRLGIDISEMFKEIERQKEAALPWNDEGIVDPL